MFLMILSSGFGNEKSEAAATLTFDSGTFVLFSFVKSTCMMHFCHNNLVTFWKRIIFWEKKLMSEILAVYVVVNMLIVDQILFSQNFCLF